MINNFLLCVRGVSGWLCCVQDLMRGAPDITNVVEACNLDGRQERLENMLSQLEQCEKALQDYLETKRIAFPR